MFSFISLPFRESLILSLSVIFSRQLFLLSLLYGIVKFTTYDRRLQINAVVSK